MYRRRGTDEDSTELVSEDSPEEVVEGLAESGKMQEEKHNVPRPLSLLKLRIASKTNSPKGKLLAWWITVSILGFVALVFVLVPLLVERGKRKSCSDFLSNSNGPVGEQPELPFFFQRDSGFFQVCRDGEPVLTGTLGVNVGLSSEVKVNTFRDTGNSILNISKVPGHEEHCIRIAWTGTSSKESPLQDCYQLGTDAHWYGAYEQRSQDWPLNFNFSSGKFENVPFLPIDLSSQEQSLFGSILHPFWLSSNGIGILVDYGVELSISLNLSHICLTSKPPHLDCASNVSVSTSLNYTICALNLISEVAQFFLNASNLIKRPAELPEREFFKSPVWTSLVDTENGHYPTSDIVDVCNSIVSSNLSVSQMELDQEYSLSFQNSLINSDTGLQEIANSSCPIGMNLSLWVHPYVGYNWSEFEVGLQNNYYLPSQSDSTGNSVSLVRWSGGYGAVTNFFSNNATRSFKNKLNFLISESGTTALNFLGGHYNYLPKCSLIDKHTREFSEVYVDFISNQSYANRSSVNVGYYTQNKPIFVRIRRNVNPNSSEQLFSLLNTVLSVGLGGYSFVIPDVMAGFQSCLSSMSITCDKLYLRWSQLNVFLPVMHLYAIPSLFSNASIIQHLRSLINLHESLNFTNYAELVIENGYPIIRPLWWIGDDSRTLTISDQFYIGDDFMVAPLLDIAQDSRMVYFPKGSSYKLATSMSDLLPSKNPCQSKCIGGTQLQFDVSLYEVLFFLIVE